jgi:hypothetical protein
MRVDRPALELVLAHVRPPEPEPNVQGLEEQLERACRRCRVGLPDDRPVKLVLLRSARRHLDNLSAGEGEVRPDPLDRWLTQLPLPLHARTAAAGTQDRLQDLKAP